MALYCKGEALIAALSSGLHLFHHPCICRHSFYTSALLTISPFLLSPQRI